MIGKLRWKVVGLNMLFAAAVLLAVFAGVVLSARTSLRQNTEEQLRQALSGAMSYQHSSLPCFVAEVFPSGTVRISGSEYYQLDETTLRSVVQECMAQSDDAGVLPSYRLRYLRETGFSTIRIAFTDSSLEQATLRSLVLTSPCRAGGAVWLQLFALRLCHAACRKCVERTKAFFVRCFPRAENAADGDFVLGRSAGGERRECVCG